MLLIFLVGSTVCAAQITEDSLTNSILPQLDLVNISKKEKDKEKEEKKPAPKKKKNEFYGIKSKKQFTKLGKGPRQTIELFYYLPTFQEPSDYVPDVYWFDLKKRKITTTKNIDKNNMRLLHGSYTKLVGGKVVEEGHYYKGVKHGRWEQYNAKFILLDKTKYYRGWLEESKITYYDAARTKIKEIIPVEYGVVQGQYYQYYDEGQLAVEGRYENGKKVGKWVEYYQYRRRRKKETQYPATPFDKEKPYILKEWDDKGKLTYEAAEEKKNLSKF